MLETVREVLKALDEKRKEYFYLAARAVAFGHLTVEAVQSAALLLVQRQKSLETYLGKVEVVDPRVVVGPLRDPSANEARLFVAGIAMQEAVAWLGEKVPGLDVALLFGRIRAAVDQQVEKVEALNRRGPFDEIDDLGRQLKSEDMAMIKAIAVFAATSEGMQETKLILPTV